MLKCLANNQFKIMKKLIYSLAILFSCCLVKVANAQIQINLGVNINSQPTWGPVGYDHAEYYYMPEIGCYYSVPTRQYIYRQNNRWVRTTYLPQRYANYNLYNGYKVVLNERDPWMRDNIYRVRYAKYRGRHDQVVIRDSRDEKYRKHWEKQQDKYDKQEEKEMKHEMKDRDKEMKHMDKGRKHGD
jgi:hypothetical protein